VLRAWERRYEAVLPRREATQRRLYSDQDIEKLRLLKLVVDAGRRISDVADLSMDDLRRLAEEDRPTERRARASSGTDIAEADFLSVAMRAVETLDAARLSAVLDQAALRLSRPRLRDTLVAPLAQAIGHRWMEGSLRIAEEHLASSVLRSFLGGLLRAATDPPAGAPVIVVATLPGDLHEIGALLAGSVASDMGWRVIFLGANLPAEEIAAAAARSQARVVALSLVYPAGSPQVAQDLHKLRRSLPPATRILVGGASVPSYARVLEQIDAVTFPDLNALQDWLTSGRP
jgi:methylmalonyl-CoA mutase cobalamin-binding subunit/DNA-binding transcriptional MerR regulator